MKTAQIGLIGASLSHSYSKEIHERLCRHPYALLEVTPEQLHAFLDQKRFRGLNVTIPYKQEVMEHLDWMEYTCRQIGSCNTIVNRSGRLYGYNTDYYGIFKTFQNHAVSITQKKVLILGHGGVARAFHAFARNHRARWIQSVYYKEHPETISYQEAYEKYSDAQIIINATPVGTNPDLQHSPIDLSRFPDLEFVYDAIYNPAETKLLQQAKSLGIKAANGLRMLIEQAIKANELFFARSLRHVQPVSLELKLLYENLNFVLIGMPSAGKTLSATLLASQSKKKAYDVDALIEKMEGMPIFEIFQEKGEAYFRAREKEVIQKLAREKGIIISTGGGSLLDPDNLKVLSQNGLMIYIDRRIDLLISDDPSRPLLARGIETLYEQRKGIYERAYDVRIINDTSIKDLSRNLSHYLRQLPTYARFLSRKDLEAYYRNRKEN